MRQALWAWALEGEHSKEEVKKEYRPWDRNKRGVLKGGMAEEKLRETGWQQIM